MDRPYQVKSRHLPTERPGEGATYCAGSCIRNFMEDPDPETKIAENLPKSAVKIVTVKCQNKNKNLLHGF